MAYSQSRQDSSGTLKTTISLGRTPAIIHSGPFYLMKEPPEASELTGATNLLIHHHLNNTYTKLSNKKKNELKAYLHHITDVSNPNSTRNDAESTLQSLLEKRIIGSKEISPMTATQLIGFRLHPGALPPQYRIFTHLSHKKQKKHKKKTRTQDQHDGSGPSEFVDPTIVEKKKKEKRKEKKKDKRDKKEKKRKTHGTDEPNSGVQI